MFDVYNNGDQLTVDSCYINNSISATFRFIVVPNNPRELSTNNLIFLSTDICQAEFAIINIMIFEVSELSLFFVSLLNIKKNLHNSISSHQ